MEYLRKDPWRTGGKKEEESVSWDGGREMEKWQEGGKEGKENV